MTGLNTWKTIGEYKINLEAHIGDGASGFVYSGNINNTEQKVAGKKILHINTEGNNIQHFIKEEIKVLKKFKNEPHFLHMLDHVDMKNPHTNKDETWIITEYCEHGHIGEYVKDLRTEKGYNDQQLMIEKINLFIQAAKAFTSMHEKEVIHRDIKEANILVANENNNTPVVKIADFGVSREIHDRILKTVVGTKGYSAPEIEKENYTTAVDVYAFGRTLQKMYSTDSVNIKQREKDMQACYNLHPVDIPQALQGNRTLKRLLKSMLQHDAAKRPSMSVVWKTLETVRSDLSTDTG